MNNGRGLSIKGEVMRRAELRKREPADRFHRDSR
jgi:hypothetical protein